MTKITLTADMPIMITSDLRLRIARGGRPVIVKTVPQTMFVDAHERQCDSNHRQTLDRIRQRGGFDAAEAVAVLSCLDYDATYSVTEESAHRILYSMIALHNGGMRVAERRAALAHPAQATPSAPEPVQKMHELPEGHRWCRHCEQKDPHCSVCEGVGYLPSAVSGDAGEGAMSKRTLVLCVSGKGSTPHLEVHFANLADAHAAHNELLGIKEEAADAR